MQVAKVKEETKLPYMKCEKGLKKRLGEYFPGLFFACFIFLFYYCAKVSHWDENYVIINVRTNFKEGQKC